MNETPNRPRTFPTSSLARAASALRFQGRAYEALALNPATESWGAWYVNEAARCFRVADDFDRAARAQDAA